MKTARLRSTRSPGPPTPPALGFTDETDQTFDTSPLKWEDNLQYWEKLHKVFQEEPAFGECRPMYGLLIALGIQKDKPFAPETTKA